MDKINDGGSAFPAEHANTNESKNGITLRDWFAAHAPDKPDDWFLVQDKHPGWFNSHNQAKYYETQKMRWRWAYADAMIAERQKGGK